MGYFSEIDLMRGAPCLLDEIAALRGEEFEGPYERLAAGLAAGEDAAALGRMADPNSPDYDPEYVWGDRPEYDGYCEKCGFHEEEHVGRVCPEPCERCGGNGYTESHSDLDGIYGMVECTRCGGNGIEPKVSA